MRRNVRPISAGPVSGSIEGALEVALETTPRLPRDMATVQLALRYAELLDDLFAALGKQVAPEDAERDDGAEYARTVLAIARTGARFEATLDRLGMAPSARPAVTGIGGGEHGPTAEAVALEQLRADASAGAPASGVDYAAAVDPAVAAADAAD
jgi:hypothetical protein